MSYDDIQDLIDEGLQFAADELGPPHDVYRVGPDSSGNIIDPSNKIATGVSIFTKIAYGAGIRDSFEAERTQGIIWYRVIADMRAFKVGDVFVVNDPVYGAGSSSVSFETDEFKGFALADHSPIKKALAGRLNCNVTIARPAAGPNAQGQFDKTKREALPLVLNDGVFSFGAKTDTACQIPAGLMATGRSYGDRSFSQVPAEQRKSSWALYLPALPGLNAREGDRIIGPDGSRYILVVPFTQHVGASGSQWLLERELGAS